MEPRPAATVVAARDTPAGIEVLMLRRSSRSRFAPGFAVFPGGAVEPGDAALAGRWFGDPGQAARACAVRELAEETGLALTKEGPRPLVPAGEADALISAAPPRLADLPEIARWIAPEFLTVRFDARFFALAVPAGLAVRPDGVEVDEAWWAVPAEVLASHRLYESLMWPTHRTLQALAACPSVEEVLRLEVPQEPPPAGGHVRSPEWHEPARRREA